MSLSSNAVEVDGGLKLGVVEVVPVVHDQVEHLVRLIVLEFFGHPKGSPLSLSF